jgi:uncharacterized protein YfaS (alpha-2-macroglobulin family)
MRSTRVLIALLLVMSSCLGSRKKPVEPAATVTPSSGPIVPWDSVTGKLSETAAPNANGGGVNNAAGAQTGAPALTPLGPALPAGGKNLTPQETKQVLDRMQPISEEKTDQTDFLMREKSMPTPRTGKDVKAPFPAPTELPKPKVDESGPLTVTRKAPEGDINLVPEVSVTFSQPMVAVTSVEEIAKIPVPVKITPEVPGQWRWVGSKTVLFKPDGEKAFGRFPMATDFTVEIPKGTKSANGGVLEKTESFSFSTPPPKIVSQWPYSGAVTNLSPTFFIAFDQKIIPADVLSKVLVTAGTSKPALILLTEAEAKANKEISSYAQSAEPGRWLAFKAKGDFAKDTQITVTLGPGVPSAEGPLKTTRSESMSFRTYGPLRFTKGYCDYYNNDCYPNAPIYAEFNNPIQYEKFDGKKVTKISPELSNVIISPSGNYIYFSGKTKSRTTYKVELLKDITDIYGQKLEKDVSFSVTYGENPKSLTAAKSGFVVIDPAAGPTFSIFSVNHKDVKVRLFTTGPEDWETFVKYQQTYYYNENKPTPPGKEIFNKTVAIKNVPDELVETKLDLKPALKEGLGQAFIMVESTIPSKNYWENRPIFAWVQVTKIGLDAASDATDLFGFANNLTDGKPLEGVELSLYPSGTPVKTGKDGFALLPLADSSQTLLLAKKGKDLAILPNSAYGGAWMRANTKYSELRWMVFDDRKMYRPGEEVKIKGWLRDVDPRERGDVGKLPAWVKKISYKVTDSRSVEIGKGEVSVNPFGGFDLSLKLPKTPNLGYAYVNFDILNSPDEGYYGTETTHYFQIEEFRRPEFEVSAKVGAGPFFMDSKVEVTANAKYFAGGVLPGADVAWYTNTYVTSFTPPNQGEYVFGEFIPWWGYYDYSERGYGGYGYGSYDSRTFNGKTDGAGNHRITLDFNAPTPPRPLSVTANATVFDVNRQAINANASFLVHPASLYVGLKSEKYFVQKGDLLLVDTIVSDLDGKLVKGISYKLKAVRYDWVQDDKGTIEWKELDPQECAVTSSADPYRCKFATKEGGTYFVTAEIKDEKGRANSTKMTLWVAGGKLPPSREVQQGQITMIPDKKEYKAGDVAEILVQAPFTPAEGILSIRRSGILKTERFTIPANGTYIAKVKIEEEHVPNVYVQVDVVGGEIRTNEKGEALTKLAPKPAYATGQLNLLVPPKDRTLAVKVTPQKAELPPGASNPLTIKITDSKGRPVANSEVAVVVVDESVLSLTGYKIPDPLSIFYSIRYPGANDYHTRQDIVLSDNSDVEKKTPDKPAGGKVTITSEKEIAESPKMEPAEPMPSPITAAGDEDMSRSAAGPGGGGSGANIQVRTDFNALALFAASVTTDKDGNAIVPMKMPDNLTRYRIMAVAVEGDKQFGSGESTITAKLPLMVRPSPPRFLNFGDKFELPVVLQNQTNAEMEVDVAVRATNTSLLSGMGYKVKVPANDRIEVRFPMETKLAGIARFQVGASSGATSDAAEFSLPVYTPATTEAFATYGTIDKGAIVQPIQAPDNVFSAFGGAEITTSSTALSELTDAVLYLQAYPYECAEQLASRVISVAALKDTLSAFKAEGLPSPEAMIEAMKRDITKLKSMQNYDGSFGFWQRGDQSWPYLSIHVAHAMARAKEKGFDVPSDMISMSLSYLQNIEYYYPSYYSKEIRAVLNSYAVYTRMRLGDTDVNRAKQIIKDNGAKKLSLEALGWLLPVLDTDKKSNKTEIEEIRKILASRVSETAGAANFTTSYGDSAYLLLHSDRRVDGILLEAMIADDEKNDLIPKLVRGLLNQRKAGKWSNTQENAFVLLALDKYFNTFEKITPDFVANAWLGDKYVGGNEFKGRSTDRYQMEIPMLTLQTGKAKKDFILSKEGEGRLYYRLGMNYAPTDLKLKPADYGFTVMREYEAIDHKDDVRKDDKGVWHIKAGAQVRVRITMIAQSRRYHVALVDPLPAGFEAQNPALKTTGPIAPDTAEASYGPYWWWYRTWYEHQNLRDERVEAFTSLLWDGVYTYSYVARATTPGSFVVPPAKAEEMYAPETFGRSGSDFVIVE